MTPFSRLGSVFSSLGQVVFGDRSPEIIPPVQLPPISFLRDRSVNRVAIYLDSLQGYGADKVLVKITNGLAEKGIQVDLVVAKKPTQTIQELHPDIQLFDLGSSRKQVLKNIFGLTRYLCTHQPDVLFSSIHFNNVTATTSLVLAELVSGIHSRLVLRQANTLRYHLKSYPFGVGAVLGLCTRLAYKKADVLISQSEGMSRDMIEFMKADPCKIRLIYNPTVTQDIFEKAQQLAGHRWVDQHDAPLIVAAGRLKPQKDFTMLLQAFAKVKQTIADVRLVILGEGPQRTELETLAAQLGIADSVDLPGFQRNPYAFLAMADLFVLSSRYEGLPNILIEALALGKRIVSTDCESGPVEILKHGKYGTLVPVGDVDRIAEAMQATLQEPFACIREPQATVDFQQRSQVEQYIRVFSTPIPQKDFLTGIAMRWQMRLLNASLRY
jgi:glycosyltransferase involved in cell wall biosynthesis